MNQLDPIKINLHGRHLIEASAGTGKTYTITGIYLRLVLERRLAVENILVVTFTDAACRELKDKIRARLALAHRKCGERLGQGGDAGEEDQFIDDLFNKYENEGQNISVLEDRLALALMDFDLAAVYTIHGFCLRVLQDSAFESSFPFELDFIDSDRELLQQVIDDYWRGNSGRWPGILVDYLCRLDWTADNLPKIVSPLLAAARSAGETALRWPPLIAPDQLKTDLAQRLINQWQAERQAILTALESPTLSRAAKAYKDENVKNWAGQLDDYGQTMSGVFPLTAVEAFAQNTLIKNTKPSKKGQTPEHAFFTECDSTLTTLQQAAYGVLRECLRQGLTTLPELKLKNGIVSFDDLLGGVHDGLCDSTSGRELAVRVGRQYPVALIDEFQDTDALQYDIFRRIYDNPGMTLFMVGDPKQAIYSFRGADIFSYLEAAANVVNSHTLTTNWRSEPDLTGVVNFLFKRHPTPFVLPQIRFSDVAGHPALKKHLVRETGNDAPLTILQFPEQKNRDTARRLAAAATAGQINNLLAEAAAGQYYIMDESGARRNISAGDIAVLVRKNSEGELVRQALGEIGLPAIIQSASSVYNGAEARELELILRAVHRAGDEKLLRAALCTRLLGVSAGELLALEENEDEWEAQLFRLAEYQKIWRQRGPATMLSRLLENEGVYQRLSSQDGAERLFTNLRHLMELLQTASHEQGLEPGELLAWLAVRRHDERPNEDCQIRLESDENLIKIVTIHKSKGLQYPVVFCPFLWDSLSASSKKDSVVICHENNRLVVDIAGEDRARIEQRDRETLAEELRLLYVAATRAKHRCYLFWGRVKCPGGWATATSSLQYLLAREALDGGESAAVLQEKFKAITDDFLITAKLVEDSKQRIALAPAVVAARPFIDPEKAVNLREAQQFNRQFNHYGGITSFSALHRDAASHEIEEPDRDRQVETEVYPSVPVSAAESDIFNFPRGAQAGSCLHEILENLDFQQDVRQQESLIEENLALYGIESAWLQTVCRIIDNTMRTTLDKAGNLTLGMIPAQDRLAEMEFYYPVPAIDRSRLAAMFKADEKVEISRETQGGHGYMKGFIDLIFCWQNRYYIVDYKSNFLGGALADYSPPCLDKAMRRAGYDLQYRIYAEALQRYLARRLPDYDYQRHFGGVYYLFLRGMRPDGGHYGVYFR